MRHIQYKHMNLDKFHDIAYHFVIAPDGKVYEGRGWWLRGVLEAANNQKSYSFAYIGTADSKPTDVMRSTMGKLIRCAIGKNYLSANPMTTNGSQDRYERYPIDRQQVNRRPDNNVPVTQQGFTPSTTPIISDFYYNGTSDYVDYDIPVYQISNSTLSG